MMDMSDLEPPFRKKRRVQDNNDNNSKLDDRGDGNNVPSCSSVSSSSSSPPFPSPVLEVFTAVEFSDDDDDNNTSNTINNNNSFVAPAQSLWQFKTFALLLGLLIGVFIQFSSLGANYLVEQVAWLHNHNNNNSNSGDGSSGDDDDDEPLVPRWGFTLLWSMGTSTVGVLLLMTLRSLMLAITSSNRCTSTTVAAGMPQQQQHQPVVLLLLLVMECHFAVGALTGVCLAWMGTDVVLRSPRHLMHSCITLVVALGWCQLLVYCFPVLAWSPSTAAASSSEVGAVDEDDDDDDDDEWMPLHDLECDNHNNSNNDPNNSKVQLKPKNRVWVQCTSLFLGSLIGLFIQFSSLGGNFLMQQLQHHNSHYFCFVQTDVFLQLFHFWLFQYVDHNK